MTPTRDIAATILAGFDKHYSMFREISAAAKDRFERSAWPETGEANRARIRLYDERVAEATSNITDQFGEWVEDDAVWPEVKLAYIGLLHEHRQPECAETFYNSVVCRLLHRSYYQNEFIFFRPAISTEHLKGEQRTYNSWYPKSLGLTASLKHMLQSFELDCPWQDIDRDVAFIERVFEEKFAARQTLHPNHQIQALASLFFRNKAAYIIGRERNGHAVTPFVIPILKSADGELVADALLTDEATISRLFSFSRAYFMVDMEVPSAYVQFLRSLMPVKPKLELYSLLGLQKYGKTLFYRDLHHHLDYSTDNFIVAPGIRGMVMLVFTMPSLHFVFKIIKDRFEQPKESNRDEVKSKYQLVKNHDRVGRLADTLEYSNVALPIERIDPELLAQLQEHCGSSIEVDGDELIIKHVYIERRMIPLNEFMNVANAEDRDAAIDGYGQAIRDLASANIFPGDMMLKNFGVTDSGRVVFYDYDEIVYMTECNFRHVPPAPPWMDELSSEPWYSVQSGDVFPEQFESFFFADSDSRDAFYRNHQDLIDPAYWNERKQLALEGRLPDVFPYPVGDRFSARFGVGG
ncbi:MAG: bifunctional isocitrate dehydrogenase kinase/phosphatase [Pseudomonadota bacterium]